MPGKKRLFLPGMESDATRQSDAFALSVSDSETEYNNISDEFRRANMRVGLCRIVPFSHMYSAESVGSRQAQALWA